MFNKRPSIDTVLRSLCVRDPRFPDYDASAYDDVEPKPRPRSDCYCGACITGKDRLAVEILRLHGELKKLDAGAMRNCERVAADVEKERIRQNEKWGVQDHDFPVWLAILSEEIGEASKAWLENHFSESRAELIRIEMVQVAAVAQAIINCGDRNRWWNTKEEK